MKCKILSVLMLALGISVMAQPLELKSPDQNLVVTISTEKDISCSVAFNNSIATKVKMAMELEDGTVFGENAKIVTKSEQYIKNKIEAPLSTKFSVITDEYNLLTLNFNNYAIEMKVYNNGFAYRFVTSIKKQVIIKSETVDLDFNDGSFVYFPEEESLISHYERVYKYSGIKDIEKNKFCSLPFLTEPDKKTKVLFTESDVKDYPNLFMEKSGENSFGALFPKYVLETQPAAGKEDRDEVIVKEADYIAKTTGDRTFPWRVLIIGDDKDIFASTLVYQLASPNKLKDTSWIKPGQIAWDWYNANNIYNVDFKSGLNTQTYKYYIDFAAENNIEYIILDEGWSKSTTDIKSSSDILDVEELVKYGKEKGVGIIAWVLWKPLNQDIPGILDIYKSWGIVGIKVDFMQRADQQMVNYYEKVGQEAAKRQLLVDFHGAYKPSGLYREYPNVLTFEGVKGNENNKWSKDITPDHNLTIPFTRMVAGPMDYTPGSMENAQKKNFNICFQRPMSLGTRCHELSKYVIFESPLQMLCDSPSRYKREQETVDFIAQIPVIWDETKVLEAKISDYMVVARRSGENWYIAAMTDWTPRDFDITLNFIPEGEYTAQIMQDGCNADRFAEDYKFSTITVKKDDTFKAVLANGGGWVAILKKK